MFGLPTYVLAETKNAISQYPQITKVKIFGSRAKGNYKRYSDVDIAIFGDFDRNVVMNLRDDLEELDVIYKFDIVHYESLTNTDLQEHIDRVGIDL